MEMEMPWKLKEVMKFYPDGHSELVDYTVVGGGRTIATVDTAEDVALLVKAVNCHGDLLTALKLVAASEHWRCSEDAEWDIINAAIRKATA